jgi:hypothetical protein
MTNEYIFICLYLFFGACVGFVTYSQRHLFSEGPRKKLNSDNTSALEGLVFWVMVCTCLWPIMVITRINTAWVLFKRKKQSQK